VDSYLQQDFVNQTASEVVTTIASQYDLICQVTPTQGAVGRYFGDGYTRLSLGDFSRIRSNWDLIVELARESNFDVFVNGTTLFYQPVVNILDSAIELTPGDVSLLRVTRKVSSSSNSEVRVQSWNAQQQSSYTSSGVLDETGVAMGGSTSQSYLFSSPNLTSSQADAYAQRYAREVGRLQTVLHIEMPSRPTFSPRTLIQLVGCGASIDGLYHVDSVERHFSAVFGTSQTIRAVSWPIV
jgi:phage protein D